MRSTESIAVIELIMLVGDVGTAKAHHPVLAERLSDGHVQRVVARKVVRTVAVKKARAVIDGHGGEAAPRQFAVEARRERVALVVVKVEAPFRRRRKIREPTGDPTKSLRLLVRIHEMGVVVAEQERRTDRDFGAPDSGRVNCERQKYVGVSNRIMIEEILHTGAEVGDAGYPVSNRNSDAVFLLDVAFALQRKKGHPLAGGVLEQRARH